MEGGTRAGFSDHRAIAEGISVKHILTTADISENISFLLSVMTTFTESVVFMLTDMKLPRAVTLGNFE